MPLIEYRPPNPSEEPVIIQHLHNGATDKGQGRSTKRTKGGFADRVSEI